jgi:hypothetical protein
MFPMWLCGVISVLCIRRIKLSIFSTLHKVHPVRWPGRKAGVGWNVREEHLSALSFLVLFATKAKSTKKGK